MLKIASFTIYKRTVVQTGHDTWIHRHVVSSAIFAIDWCPGRGVLAVSCSILTTKAIASLVGANTVAPVWPLTVISLHICKDNNNNNNNNKAR